MPELITLADMRELLWAEGAQQNSYAAATAAELAEWTKRCNRVTFRLINEVQGPYMYRRVVVPIYDSYITLPRNCQSLLGVAPINQDGCSCSPLLVYSRFHEFAVPYEGCTCCQPIAAPVSETAQTFRDPAPGFKLKVTSTAAGGTYKFIGGRDTDWDEYFDSEEVTIINGSVTTTREWNGMPRIVKSATTVGIQLYSVDTATAEETLIAIHAPNEKSPAYQRYHVPECSSFVAARILTKLCFVKLESDTDIVIPNSQTAIQLGLQALNFELTSNWSAADAQWAKAARAIDNEKSRQEGEAELPVFQSVPEFGASDIPCLR